MAAAPAMSEMPLSQQPPSEGTYQAVRSWVMR